jgi:hypothetical protein
VTGVIINAQPQSGAKHKFNLRDRVRLTFGPYNGNLGFVATQERDMNENPAYTVQLDNGDRPVVAEHHVTLISRS